MAGASGSIMAGMLIVGAGNVALAETTEVPATSYMQNTTGHGMHMMRRWNSRGKINTLAGSLGLDPAMVGEELKSGKALKQILQENGIVPGQLQKAFESGEKKKSGKFPR